MLWVFLSVPSIAQAQDCVWSGSDGYETIQAAIGDGATDIVVDCDHQELALEVDDGDEQEGPVTVTVTSRARLRLCSRYRPVQGVEPALSVRRRELSVVVTDGTAVVESPLDGVFVGPSAHLSLTGVEVTGWAEDCEDTGIPSWYGYGWASLLDVRGELDLVDGEVRGGLADEGGAATVVGRLTATGTRFVDNRAGFAGGAVFLDGGELVLDDVVFEGNLAGYQGGAVDLGWGSSAEVSIHGGRFEGNRSGAFGGAIAHQGTQSLEIVGTEFRDNQVAFDVYTDIYPYGSTTFLPLTYGTFTGGAVDSVGDLSVEGALFEGNAADFGSALAVGSSSSVTDSTFRGNQGAGALKVRGGAYVSLSGLVFDDNRVIEAYAGLDVADLLVDGGAVVEATSLAMCGRSGSGTRIHAFGGAVVDVRGLLAHTTEAFSSGSGRVDLRHATLSSTGTGGALFGGEAKVTESILMSPGQAPGTSVALASSLVDLSAPFVGDQVVNGPAFWVVAGDPSSEPCNPSRYRPYPGTAGTVPMGSSDGGAPDRADPIDDWGAWGQPTGWSWLFQEVDVGVDDPFAGTDDDGVPWIYDCDVDDGAVSALHPEVCDDRGIDENCDGLVGADGAAEVGWAVDHDRDGLSGEETSCQEPPWSVDPGGPYDCDDHDPTDDPAGLAWIDGDGDGVPALQPSCDGEEGLPSWEGPPDCDDTDGSVWRVGPVLFDGDGDGAAGDPVGADVQCVGDQPLAPSDGRYDCDDDDSTRFPGALDTPDDGVDQDCDGADATAFAVGGCSYLAAAGPAPWTWGLARRR